MARLVAWLNKYADSGLALILAIGVGILALADIASTNDVNGAILLTLGLVATSSLRNRAREEAMDTQLHDVLQTTAAMLTRMPARLDELESTVESTRRAPTESSFMRVLHGAEVGVALEEARRNTDRWVFKGGTGTFLRAVTLPECVSIARRKKHAMHLQLEIIDPTDEKVCGGAMLATAGDDLAVRLWDVRTGEHLHSLLGHTRRVWSVAFSPDGTLLASAGDDGAVGLWDTSGSEPPRLRLTLLGLPEGWAALADDGRYKQEGDIAGQFWHVVGMCRFGSGELDSSLTAVRGLPLDAEF